MILVPRFLVLSAWLCVPAICLQDTTPTFGSTVVIPSGLHGYIYHISHRTTHLPEFRKMKPVGSIYTTSLDIPSQSFSAGFPGVTDRLEWFAVEYSGRFWIQKPGEYRFELTSDDGAKLYVDEQLVVDNDGLHPPATVGARVSLEGGIHRIRVSYFQGRRFQVALQLYVAGTGEKLRAFSTDEFKPPPDPDTWLFQRPDNTGKRMP